MNYQKSYNLERIKKYCFWDYIFSDVELIAMANDDVNSRAVNFLFEKIFKNSIKPEQDLTIFPQEVLKYKLKNYQPSQFNHKYFATRKAVLLFVFGLSTELPEEKKWKRTEDAVSIDINSMLEACKESNVENLVIDKIVSIMQKDILKDIVDLYLIDNNHNIDWHTVIENAREKVHFQNLDFIAKLRDFPVEYLDNIKNNQEIISKIKIDFYYFIDKIQYFKEKEGNNLNEYN